MALLEARHVTKVFDSDPDTVLHRIEAGATSETIRADTGAVVAVRDATFDVRAGELFVVMGLSGSGKSTLLRCLNRLVDPTRGTVRIDGEDVTAASEDRLRALRRSTMSMVFQHFGLFPHRTVRGNVEYGLEISGVASEVRAERVQWALSLVGLEADADRRPSALSGGMQQRVGLARALANDPEILLMDEAFSALDPLLRAEMQHELLELQRDLNRTIVFITHDLDEALTLGDRIAIMQGGRIVQIGTPEAILLDPADDYVRSFVQNVDRLQVLSAGAVMTDVPAPATDGTTPARDEPAPRSTDGPTVTADTPLAQVLPTVLDADGPVAVVDADGRRLGTIDRETVLQEVARNAGC
jgi:glycine betaine/proline transport system ATP-binding protein